MYVHNIVIYRVCMEIRRCLRVRDEVRDELMDYKRTILVGSMFKLLCVTVKHYCFVKFQITNKPK